MNEIRCNKCNFKMKPFLDVMKNGVQQYVCTNPDRLMAIHEYHPSRFIDAEGNDVVIVTSN